MSVADSTVWLNSDTNSRTVFTSFLNDPKTVIFLNGEQNNCKKGSVKILTNSIEMNLRKLVTSQTEWNMVQTGFKSGYRGQSYKANFGINYIKNINFTLNHINFDVIYAKKVV